MDTSSIPKHVDVLIVGTGLTNSIIAAACSRIGKSVLHLDQNNFYGQEWASFTLQQLLDWIKEKQPNDESLTGVPEELINKSRMFCIDLAPRFLFSNGALVELLVKSNVARYHEFKNNIRILCMVDDDINIMPCRRNEVFTSPLLKSLSDKRRLMKFIELCMKYEGDHELTDETQKEFDFSGDEPIDEYLTQRGLAPNLREHIINSIAMVKPSEPMKNACKKIKQFMIATQRYGRSPFLFPIYGCGEFPQSFCRLSAVFGGIYCLNTQIKDVTISNKEETAVVDPESELSVDSKRVTNKFLVKFSEENHQVESDMLVLEQATAVDLKLVDRSQEPADRLSRAILITNKSIVPLGDSESATTQDRDMISFLRIPPSDRNKSVVFIIELNPTAMVCPKDSNLVYLWTQSSSEDARLDLNATIERIYRGDTECIRWKYFYQQASETGKKQTTAVGGDDENVIKSEQSTPGLYITGRIACDDIDYTSVIQEAETLFAQMCPDQEFLPRAPDSDEIISS